MTRANVTLVMRVTVTVEMGTRTAMEQVATPGMSRKHFRAMMSDAACRMELATYGGPGPVPEMAADDMPRSFATPGPHIATPDA